MNVCVRVCVYAHTRTSVHMYLCVCVCVCSREWALWGQKAWQVSTDDGSRWRGAERCQGRRERERPPHGGSHPVTSSHVPSLFSPSCPLLSSPLLSTPPFSSTLTPCPLISSRLLHAALRSTPVLSSSHT